MKVLKYINGFCLIALLLFGCSKNTIDPNIDVEAEIIKEMQDFGIPSLTACIVKDNQIVWEGAFGYANISNSEPADRLTLYTAMSISKLLIATAIMQLREKDLIDPDVDINNYLPFFVRNPKYPDEKITSRMLLTHTSSLAWPVTADHIPNFYYLFPADEMPMISEWLPDYILPDGNNYRSSVWKDYKPGEKELYSNIGTPLLALIVETVSGSDYMDYCQENILDPLEMYNTAFRFNELDEGLLATPYWNMHSSIHHFNYRHYPAGNLKSNIEDFSHFIIAMLNNGMYKEKKILSKESVEQMFEIHNPTSGMGLMWSNGLGDCIGHSGGGEGFSARAEWFPGRGKGMVVFTNRWNKSVYPQGRIYELLRYQCNKY